MANAKFKIATLVAWHIILIVVAILIAVLGSNQCVRRDCVKKSKFILKTMDLSSDPCNDFFRFGCGNYKNVVEFRKGIIKQKQRLPSEKPAIKGINTFPFASVIYYIQDNVDRQVRYILEKPLKVTDDRCLKIVKKIFQPCTSRALVAKQGIRPLWSAILKTGGFPLVEGDKWNEKGFSLAFMEYTSRKIGFAGQHIFQSYIAQGGKSSGKYFIHIEPPIFENTPGHEIITDLKTDHTIMMQNYASMVERLIFHLLGNRQYETNEFKTLRKKYEPGWGKIIELKKALGKARDAYLKLQDPVDLYNEMTLESFMNEFPYVDWKFYFQNMLSSNKLPSTVIVIGTSYFKRLRYLLGNTTKQEIANFLVLHNTFDAMRFLPTTYFAIYNKFLRNIYPSRTSFLSRKEFCGDMVKTNLRPALSSLFLEKYNLTQNSQNVLEDMSGRIASAIESAILNSEWMDGPTKEEAFLKLQFTKFSLSLPDKDLEQLRSEEARSKYYESLCIGTRQTQVLPNYFCLNKFMTMKNWELLSREASVFDKALHVFESEIRYNQKRNEFIVPYGILQMPAFSGVWPGYLNYGGIGSRVGQRLSEGYDLNGNTVDHLGFDKASWWTPQTSDNYKRLARCFADDYVTFMQRRARANSKFMSRENSPDTTRLAAVVANKMADFQGLRLAHEAYSAYSRARFLKEPTLPGLEHFSAKQLFYISFANARCAVYLPENETNWVSASGEIHSEFQVVASLKNERGFRDAFQCRPGSEMNPSRKCKSMW